MEFTGHDLGWASCKGKSTMSQDLHHTHHHRGLLLLANIIWPSYKTVHWLWPLLHNITNVDLLSFTSAPSPVFRFKFCYIPIFHFELHPKFPFLFHTLTFPTSSYSILQCFPILHFDVSNVSHCLPTFFRTPMFSLLQCFPYFYRCGTFQTYYGLIIIMEPFQ